MKHRSLFLLVCTALLTLTFTNCKKDAKKEYGLETEQVTAVKTFYLTENQTDSLCINYDIEYPTHLKSKDVLREIQQSLREQIFGAKYKYTDLRHAIDMVIEEQREEYFRTNLPELEMILADEDLEMDNFTLFSFNTEDILQTHIMGIHNGTLSYAVDRYIYNGGAHGYESLACYNYCLESGKLLTEEDIFIEGYTASLVLLLKQAVESSEAKEEIMSMSDFFGEDIQPNGNFYLDGNGVHYIYNPYEIAPYSAGIIDLCVSWQDLQEAELLK